ESLFFTERHCVRAGARLKTPQLAADGFAQVGVADAVLAPVEDVARAGGDGGDGWKKQLKPVEQRVLRTLPREHDEAGSDRRQADRRELQSVVVAPGATRAQVRGERELVDAIQREFATVTNLGGGARAFGRRLERHG